MQVAILSVRTGEGITVPWPSFRAQDPAVRALTHGLTTSQKQRELCLALGRCPGGTALHSTERPGGQCPPASPGDQGPGQFCLWPVRGGRGWGFISPRAGEKPREVFSAHGQPMASPLPMGGVRCHPLRGPLWKISETD